jgi:hypothetical protein
MGIGGVMAWGTRSAGDHGHLDAGARLVLAFSMIVAGGVYVLRVLDGSPVGTQCHNWM